MKIFVGLFTRTIHIAVSIFPQNPISILANIDFVLRDSQNIEEGESARSRSYPVSWSKVRSFLKRMYE